jgi:glycogen debranching enzyme
MNTDIKVGPPVITISQGRTFMVTTRTGEIRTNSFVFELSLRSDFSDLFEVKNHNIVQRGQTQTTWDKEHNRLRTTYDNNDFHRAVDYEITAIPSQTSRGYSNGRLFFQVEIEQNASWQMCANLVLEHGQQVKRPKPGSCSAGQSSASSSKAADAQQKTTRAGFDERQARWEDRCTRVVTSDNNLTRTSIQAILDMGALRIYDMDVSDEAWVPAAGVPWFVTLFGRDSLITSYQNMFVSPDFARGALKRLAEHDAGRRRTRVPAIK